MNQSLAAIPEATPEKSTEYAMVQTSCCEETFLPSQIFAKSSNFQLSFLSGALSLYLYCQRLLLVALFF